MNKKAFPLFSIVTINLNNKEGLKETIESVKNQSFTDYEYLVVDGLSSDGSVETLEREHLNIDKKIIEKDAGIFDAMNKGIQEASGKYLYFLNSGDVLHSPNIMEKIAKFAEQNGFPDVISGRIQFVMNGKRLNRFRPKRKEKWGPGLPHQATFTKTILHKENLFKKELKFVGDYEFWLRLKWKGRFKPIFIPEVISYFDVGGVSMDPKFDAKRFSERIYVDSRYGKKIGAFTYFRTGFKIILRKAIVSIAGQKVLFEIYHLKR